VNTIQALVPVGAFIAGVQAQVIAFTCANNKTSLQVTTNCFAIVGLALDVLGTSFGVLHIFALQRSIRRMEELIRSQSRNMAKFEGEDGVSELQKLIETELRIRKKFWLFRRYLPNGSLGNHLDPLFPNGQFKDLEHFVRFAGAVGLDPYTVALGTDPTLAMSAGITCLLLSVILFAASSQPKAVFLVCVTITAITIVTMVCAMLVHNECESFIRPALL
jgi:hypothetical protein